MGVETQGARDGLRESLTREDLGPSALRERPRPSHVELMIYQRLHSLDKANGVWQIGVNVERSFINPARVEVEQTGISRATKDPYGEAARFCARRGEHLTHRGRNGILLAIASMKAGEDEQLHISTPQLQRMVRPPALVDRLHRPASD